MTKIVAAPEVQADWAKQGAVPMTMTPDAFERYLADDSLSISQIAWLLGYQEVSAFTHAFRRWTGKTPREARVRGKS